MLYDSVHLKQHVEEMRATAITLSEYSSPQTETNEEEIAVLKQREIVVDGWICVVYYGKADYNTFWIDVVSITNKYGPFLPFTVLIKIATAFLGEKELSHFDYIKLKQKVYTWMLFTDKNNIPVSSKTIYEGKECKYRDLIFTLLSSEQVENNLTKPPQ